MARERALLFVGSSPSSRMSGHEHPHRASPFDRLRPMSRLSEAHWRSARAILCERGRNPCHAPPDATARSHWRRLQMKPRGTRGKGEVDDAHNVLMNDAPAVAIRRIERALQQARVYLPSIAAVHPSSTCSCGPRSNPGNGKIK